MTDLRFVLDVHLGGLARKLRMLGFDTLYFTQCDDDELIRIANHEQRLLLTRDRGILACAELQRGYGVHAIHTDQQLEEIVRAFELVSQFKPFTRCMLCNARVNPVPKAAIQDRLLPGTTKQFDDYLKCTGCEQIYWRGSHFQHMAEDIQRLTQHFASQTGVQSRHT